MTATTAETSQKSFLDVWLISIGHGFTHWYPATFYLLLPLIGNELGLSYAEIGSIFTAQFLAGAISNVPGGLIVDSVGRKGVLMAISLASACPLAAPASSRVLEASASCRVGAGPAPFPAATAGFVSAGRADATALLCFGR